MNKASGIFSGSFRLRDLAFLVMLAAALFLLSLGQGAPPPAPGEVFPTASQLEGFASAHPLAVRAAAIIFNAALCLGLYFTAYFLIVMRKRDLALDTLPAAPWCLWDVARGGILFLFAGLALALLNPLRIEGPVAALAYNLVAQSAAVLYLFRLAPVRGDALAAIGFRAGRLFRKAAFGLMAYVAFLPAFMGLVLATRLLGRYGGVELEPQRHFMFFARPHSLAGYLFIAVLMGIAAPVLEEVFFRGFLYRAFRRRVGTLSAVTASALIFSVLHFNAGTLLPIFGLGVLLAYAYERSGTLVVPIVVHVLQNSIALCVLYALLWIKDTG